MFFSPRPARVMLTLSRRAAGHMAVSRVRRGTQWKGFS